jgi:predicted dehydrogenase
MYKIVLIGAGQLGSRHLQALAKTDFEVSIEVVEPDINAVATTKQRFLEMGGNSKIKDISFFNSIDNLSNELDFVIIATNADVRYRIVKELLSKKNVKYLLLEKVLFQETDHYYKIQRLLSDTNTKCWVNHPRRMFPFYQQLKKDLTGVKQISFTMEGGNWGLACNGLHLLDLFSFLSGENQIEINTENLYQKVYASKRKNFIEFNGQLTGNIGQNLLSILSLENTTPSIITIVSEKLMAIIDESNGFIRMSSSKNNWKWENIETKIVYYQSELTHLVAESILSKRECFLPTYQEAMQLHIPFINALLKFMKKLDGKEHKNCPIT